MIKAAMLVASGAVAVAVADGRSEPAGISRHIECPTVGGRVYVFETDPAGPWYVGSGNRTTFVDRKTQQLVTTTVGCFTYTPWPLR